MTEAVLGIRKWGNSLGVRLPAAVAREAGLHVDQQVRLCVEDGKVTIVPLDAAALTPNGARSSSPKSTWSPSIRM